MHKQFFAVLFSAAMFVVGLLFAFWAQEGMAEETTAGAETALDTIATTSPTTAPTTSPTTAPTTSPTTTPERTNISPPNGGCDNPQEVLTVGPKSENTRTPFQTTGSTFRVTYDVQFKDPSDFANSAEIDVEDNLGLVDFALVFEDEANSFVVTEGAGSYDLVVNIDPPNGATYTVTVDDCVGNGGGGGGGGGGGNNDHNNRHNDHNNRHHNRFHHNRFHPNRHNDNVNVVNKQYENRVIKETIPNKGQLANTGGMPPAGVALLSLAMVGLGASILRSAIRRDS
jgi:hypothetical protein